MRLRGLGKKSIIGFFSEIAKAIKLSNADGANWQFKFAFKVCGGKPSRMAYNQRKCELMYGWPSWKWRVLLGSLINFSIAYFANF